MFASRNRSRSHGVKPQLLQVAFATDGGKEKGGAASQRWCRPNGTPQREQISPIHSLIPIHFFLSVFVFLILFWPLDQAGGAEVSEQRELNVQRTQQAGAPSSHCPTRARGKPAAPRPRIFPEHPTISSRFLYRKVCSFLSHSPRRLLPFLSNSPLPSSPPSRRSVLCFLSFSAFPSASVPTPVERCE